MLADYSLQARFNQLPVFESVLREIACPSIYTVYGGFHTAMTEPSNCSSRSYTNTYTFPWNHHEMRLLQMQVIRYIAQTSQISEHHNNSDVIFQMDEQILEKF